MEEWMDYILDFEELNKSSLQMVGGKNASLGEMIRAGIHVPPGFAVTTDSYLSFITDTGIKDTIFQTLSGLSVDDVEALNNASAEVQDLINNASKQFPWRYVPAQRQRICPRQALPGSRTHTFGLRE
jgi:pyruvate,water dikinase